ncbi:glycosyltransferase family 4 protein [Massilia sp. TS11]|uniref:glycosyltransferase family 4 protein n=1 Tax=Massilia sp. TS11 TaxID=2908003 RepID=UPI001EDB8769|nr:glycosyltransferase family 4 protein [Massilia sp. TS11]MCG2584726.1 glycosyltransferase family 4 protein [Massilia sp. TS11]
MRILHVLDHSLPARTAYARRAVATVRAQRQLGWHTVHLTGPAQGLQQEHEAWPCYRTQPAPPWLCSRRLWRAGAEWWQLRSRIRQVMQLTRPDLLHVHSPASHVLAAARLGRPILFDIHGIFPEQPQAVSRTERAALGAAAAIVCDSRALRSEIQRWVRPALPIAVVPDTLGWTESEPAEPDLRDCGRPLLGMFGPHGEPQGTALAIAALPALCRRFRGLGLVLFGSGADSPVWTQLAASLQVGPHLHLRPEIAAAYTRAVDVSLLPSLSHRAAELLPPLQALTAMRQGGLIAASDVGGHRELFEHGQTALLFPAGSVEGLVDVLSLFLAHPEAWEAMRLAARRRALHDFDETSVAQTYRPLLEGLLRPLARV